MPTNTYLIMTAIDAALDHNNDLEFLSYDITAHLRPRPWQLAEDWYRLD